jgi:hypothetical protein
MRAIVLAKFCGLDSHVYTSRQGPAVLLEDILTRLLQEKRT